MYKIKKASVIGAGTMGLGIAGQLANAGIEVLLLDLPSENGNRNAVCERAIERLLIDGFFCRNLLWGMRELKYNCQKVTFDGRRLRFISDEGKGQSASFALR